MSRLLWGLGRFRTFALASRVPHVCGNPTSTNPGSRPDRDYDGEGKGWRGKESENPSSSDSVRTLSGLNPWCPVSGVGTGVSVPLGSRLGVGVPGECAEGNREEGNLVIYTYRIMCGTIS